MHHSDLQKSIQKGGREQLIRRKLATDDNETIIEVIRGHSGSWAVLFCYQKSKSPKLGQKSFGSNKKFHNKNL